MSPEVDSRDIIYLEMIWSRVISPEPVGDNAGSVSRYKSNKTELFNTVGGINKIHGDSGQRDQSLLTSPVEDTVVGRLSNRSPRSVR